MMGSKAFESPLISHLRMRALYRALVEVRAGAGRLGARRLPPQLEACWIAPTIDLRATDLVLGGEHSGYIRAAGMRPAAGVATASAVRSLLQDDSESFAGTAAERMFCAMGAAITLKADGHGAVCMAFATGDELAAEEWRRVLTVARHGDLPLILVHAGAPGGLRLRGVPVIPVDAGDVLALYRVAQECLVRARADGGVAVIECLQMGTDPVKMLGEQLVKKQICTARWVANCEPQFQRVLDAV